MSIKYMVPQVVSASFLERFEEYQETGSPSQPVFDFAMSAAIMNTVKSSPMDAYTFMAQVTSYIIAGLYEKYPEAHYIVEQGLLEWTNVMSQFFIVSLNRSMEINTKLNSMLETLSAGVGSDTEVPVPDANPTEVFKNLEWVGINEWIKPDASA